MRHNMPPRVLSIVVFHCEEIAVAVKFELDARSKFHFIAVEVVGIIADVGNGCAFIIGFKVFGYGCRNYLCGNPLVVLHFFPLAVVTEFDSSPVGQIYFIFGTEKVVIDVCCRNGGRGEILNESSCSSRQVGYRDRLVVGLGVE